LIRQYELVERVKAYDPKADEDGLNRAYVFAMKAHGSQKRASGDPYFSHPIEVAGILTGIKLDCSTIVTALLHDTVEDTGATIEELRELFGDEIARLVDGVTKLTRLELQSDQTKQAENFRKLLLAMSDDIRVLLVKLADRLHNMRTLEFVGDPEKRHRIARETMEIYAPLAARIGMDGIKSELEDLAFAELNDDARSSVMARLEFLREQGESQLPRIIDELQKTLAKAGIKADITGREKKPYSIWGKMERKNITFEQLSDIVAFRIVVEDISECYATLGVVHGAYSMVPGRFKDYISTPKPNDYRSIHTTVIGPENQRIEIQIRTRDMHEFAELGVAAHWLYKGQSKDIMQRDGRQYRWIRELLEILDHTSDPEEFLEHTKLEMFQDQVFCFTPKGEIIALPSGATPVDFAYAVHSEVGNTCVGAKINGRMKPLRTVLQNGDQVEIVGSKAQTPSPTWERFVATGKARSAIRRFIRSQEREQYADLGRAIVQKAFRQAGQGFDEKPLQAALTHFRYKTIEDLYVAAGEGVVTGHQVIAKAFPDVKVKQAKTVSLSRRRSKRDKPDENAVPIRGLIPGMAMHFAGCCHPLPGDRIVGIVTTGKGVTIHTIDCETLETFTDSPERWLDVAWDKDNEDQSNHLGRVVVVVNNEPGGLGTLSMVIANNHGNISNLKITNRSLEFFEMIVDIEVQDVKHLSNIIAALRTTPVISSVERARG
jgi:GTP diphosphokinase / guanosine-3',5'-bis(diphosphate) 3'-diphosphatase